MGQYYSNSSNSMNDDGNVSEEKNDSNSNDDDHCNLNKELSNMNINSRRGNRNCLCCLKEVKGSSRCSKCRTALYCSRECQVKHWPVHKNNCIDSNDTENSDKKLELKAANHLKQGNCISIYTKDLSLLIYNNL